MLEPSSPGAGEGVERAVVPPEPAQDSVADAIESARRRLLELQHPDGHWCGELEGDTILESEYLLLLYFLGRFDEPKVAKAVRYLESRQQADGGWANFPGGPSDVSASVKAYFVLKMAGKPSEGEALTRARQRILELGGIEATNTYTKVYLAIFGQYPWSRCPAIPPEIVLLPRWLYFNVYAMSSWSRAIFVPLSIIWATKPTVAVPESAAIPELRVGGSNGRRPTPGFWPAVFRAVNSALVGIESARLVPLRRRALEQAERWIGERLERSAGLGAIFPGIVNSILAFRCLEHEPEDARIKQQLAELEALEVDEGDTLRLEPCKSPVWDTGNAAEALLDSGSAADAEAMRSASSASSKKEPPVSPAPTTGAFRWPFSGPESKPGSPTSEATKRPRSS